MALRGVRERFFAKHPLAQKLDDALKTGVNPTPTFFMSDMVEHEDLRNLTFTLVRLGAQVERRFGISGEVAVFHAPWGDFQRRSYNAIARDLVKISNRCQTSSLQKIRFTPTTKLAIVVSNDGAAASKVAEWSQDGSSATTFVVLDAESVATTEPFALRTALLAEMRYRLGDRDLYQAQNPVTGDDFFGRTGLLRDLSASIMADQNVAIFGLRRSGKTSVIRELKRSLLSRGVVITIADMQLVTVSSLGDVARSILNALLEDLRAARGTTDVKVTVGNDADDVVDGASLANLSDRVRKIASRNPGLRLVVAVDEVEHLVQMAMSDPQEVRAFLGALRSCAQVAPNVSLVFSGVANQTFLSSSLGPDEHRVDNPMFGQVSPTFMTPFSSTETADLIRDLGRPMFLSWSADAVEAVHRTTGGWPFFVRQLASAVRGGIESSAAVEFGDDADVSVDSVDAVLEPWRRKASRTWTETIHALELHYPNAAYLLSPDVGPDSLDEWIRNDGEMEEAAECLEDLGLLVRSQSGYGFSESLTALRALAGEGPVKRIVRDEERYLIELTTSPEGQRLEFKSTARIDLATGTKARHIEEAVLKTVAAFLNADGGRLMIGVADNGSLLGIDVDLEIFGKSVDRFERWLLGDLLGAALGQGVVTRAVTVTFPKVRGCVIASVVVEPSSEPILVNDAHLYVRLGNQTKKLEGRELLDFIKARG